jgi:hypothetical protein
MAKGTIRIGFEIIGENYPTEGHLSSTVRSIRERLAALGAGAEILRCATDVGQRKRRHASKSKHQLSPLLNLTHLLRRS